MSWLSIDDLEAANVTKNVQKPQVDTSSGDSIWVRQYLAWNGDASVALSENTSSPLTPSAGEGDLEQQEQYK